MVNEIQEVVHTLLTPYSVLWAAFILLLALWPTSHGKKVNLFTQDALSEQETQSKPPSAEDLLADIMEVSGDHETAALRQKMIDTNGAGSWAPKSTHGDTWPAVLRPYHDIYLALEPSLPAKEVSLDDEVNTQRIDEFRTRMRTLLQERIDLHAVEAILSAVEAGDSSVLPAEAHNGFFACIAMSRHAFRWGTIPVIKTAQMEKFIDFPPELQLPRGFLTRHYGVVSQGDNVTSNYFYNLDKNERIVYHINYGMPKVISTSERHFARIFPAMEKWALPIYYDLIMSMICFEKGQKDRCLGFLRDIGPHLRQLLKVYYDNLVDDKILRSIWMSYVQGFQDWAAGEMIDGVYVEYDGLSGNQLPFFRIIDAFLGMDSYLTEENVQRFRHKAQMAGDVEIGAEMVKIVKQMRVFRAAHRARPQTYLSVPTPERFIMTAGKSVLESPTIRNVMAAIEFLDAMMIKRLKETVLTDAAVGELSRPLISHVSTTSINLMQELQSSPSH